MRWSMLRVSSRPGCAARTRSTFSDDAALARRFGSPFQARACRSTSHRRPAPALPAAVVDIGDAEHMRHHFPRIKRRYSRWLATLGYQRQDARGLTSGLGCGAEVDEFFVGAAQPNCFSSSRPCPAHAPAPAAGRRLQQFLRVAQIESIHRRETASGSPLRSVDHPARGGNQDLAQEARRALLPVELVVDDLQVQRARQQPAEHSPSAPPTSNKRPRRFQTSARTLFAARAASRRVLSPGRAGKPDSGRSFIGAPPRCLRCAGTPCPGGRATWSTRLFLPQVACSSCKRPNSILRCSSRALSSRVERDEGEPVFGRSRTTSNAVATLAITSTARIT